MSIAFKLGQLVRRGTIKSGELALRTYDGGIQAIHEVGAGWSNPDAISVALDAPKPKRAALPAGYVNPTPVGRKPAKA